MNERNSKGRTVGRNRLQAMRRTFVMIDKRGKIHRVNVVIIKDVEASIKHGRKNYSNLFWLITTVLLLIAALTVALL